MHDAWKMSAEDAEEYTRALGQIMSGGWRQIALAQRLGVPAALGMTTDAWVRERIGGYVRLGLDERREAARELTDPTGDFQMSQRQAAEVLGISQMTVSRDLQDEPDVSAEDASLGDDAAPDDANVSAEDGAEPVARAGSAAVGDAPSCADDDEPRQPTMGEIMGPNAGFDDTGLAEAEAVRTRYEYVNGVLDELLDMIARYGPEVMVEHERPEDLPILVKTLGPPIAWLQHAQQLASDPRSQIRRVP